MNNDISKILFSEEKLSEIVKNLGERISEDYTGKNLLVLCVMKSSLVFTADLIRQITLPCEIDYIAASSYENGTQSKGVVKIEKDTELDLSAYDVLIVEDIIDSGNTLCYLKKMIKSKNPLSVKICALFDKPDRRESEISTDYTGAVVPNEFLVGYGMDYGERYRNLPYIGILKPEIYEKK